MAERLLSVGLDVGTTTTQMVVSQLEIENKSSGFTVPEFAITHRQVLYKSPIYFTPLLEEELVDGQKLQEIVAKEYLAAGIRSEQVDTGAVIITGETSRRENARAVSQSLSEYAGDFVVATAGPDLESVLAARGSGSVAYSAQTGKAVLHMDIGGGTSNLAWIQDGRIIATGCLNVGGRLLKWDEGGKLCYISPVVEKLCDAKLGEDFDAEALAEKLVQALEMAAALRPVGTLLSQLTTKGTTVQPLPGAWVISFSGGVADCIEGERERNAFGDLGPVLGQKIKESLLCKGEYRLGEQTIRATVIGAGSYSAQLSGSTVYCQNIQLPIKSLPVIPVEEDTGLAAAASRFDSRGIFYFQGLESSYLEVSRLADTIAQQSREKQVYVAVDKDMAKALGQALALRLGVDREILCIDGVALKAGDYLDISSSVGSAFAVIVKTLIFERGG